MYLNLYNSHVIKKGIDKLFLKDNMALDGPKLKYSSIKAKNHKTFFINTHFSMKIKFLQTKVKKHNVSSTRKTIFLPKTFSATL